MSQHSLDSESGNASHTTTSLKLWRMTALAMIIIAVVFISVVPQISNDFWLQAKVGEIIARDHAVPKTILFPFTEIRDARFNAHEWLPSLMFYWLIALVGEDGLPFVMGAAGVALFSLMAWMAYRRSRKNLSLALLLGFLALGVENQRHFLRPELISLFLLGFYWLLLDACRLRPRPLAWTGALLVVILWANTHGSFILAPVIAAIYAVGLWLDGLRWGATGDWRPKQIPKAFAVFSVVALAACLVNPSGVELLQFVASFHADTAKMGINEWMPTFSPGWYEAPVVWMGLGCAAVTATVMLAQWRRLSAVEALMFLMFLVLALKTVRFLVYQGMVAAFVISTLVTAKPQGAKIHIRVYAICTFAAAVVLGLALQFGNAYGVYPHVALGVSSSFTTFMKNKLSAPDLQGNVITSYELGAELVYRAYPRLRPSIDSRIDSYGGAYTWLNGRLFLDDAVLTEYVKDYDVRYMLLNHENFRSLEKLPSWTSGRWTIRAMDQRAVLLQRSDLPPAP
ncbi:hypothetical protein [Polaromonas sp. JS666]|uniref:hypothetical protein n=1 Tax=Polaromonas sp. (strain JS666 / ATCC BAA-500) TaxID=296591 RepID=UPI00088BE9DF|nr:hypothetical protein [Polaromonas sp. JS666]SDN82638.1 hypothetical protein SAMN05720382_108126 [Polaromonas sp. JS666]